MAKKGKKKKEAPPPPAPESEVELAPQELPHLELHHRWHRRTRFRYPRGTHPWSLKTRANPDVDPNPQ